MSNREVPNLENATPGGLIDQLGDIRKDLKELKYLEGIYRGALDARCTEEQLKGLVSIGGENWIGAYKEVEQERISADLVREVLKSQPDVLAKVITVTSFKQLNVMKAPEKPKVAHAGKEKRR